MKIYELEYVSSYNPETGAVDSCKIMRTTDKAKLDKVIADHQLKVITDLQPGHHNVFAVTEFEPRFDEYFDEEALELCIKEDQEYKAQPSWSWNFWNN